MPLCRVPALAVLLWQATNWAVVVTPVALTLRLIATPISSALNSVADIGGSTATALIPSLENRDFATKVRYDGRATLGCYVAWVVVAQRHIPVLVHLQIPAKIA